jgi:hypothetical protein
MAHAAAAAKLFMVVATLCATKQGVDTCLVQADTALAKTRAECVARGQELIKNATTAFSYAHLPAPYRVKIYCAMKGTSVAKAQTGKPASTGTADVPAPVIKIDQPSQSWTEYLKTWWPW